MHSVAAMPSMKSEFRNIADRKLWVCTCVVEHLLLQISKCLWDDDASSEFGTQRRHRCRQPKLQKWCAIEKGDAWRLGSWHTRLIVIIFYATAALGGVCFFFFRLMCLKREFTLHTHRYMRTNLLYHRMYEFVFFPFLLFFLSFTHFHIIRIVVIIINVCWICVSGWCCWCVDR